LREGLSRAGCEEGNEERDLEEQCVKGVTERGN
jgi:hypothetical protein